MEFIGTTVLLVITAVLTALHYLVHKGRKGSNINKIRGPKPWPIIGNAYEIVVSPEALWKLFRTWGDDYYPIYKFWLGPQPVVNIRHPDDLEVLLNSQDNISKSLFYNFLHPWLNTGILTSTGNKWRARRKLMTPAFHANVLKEFIGVFTDVSERMVKTLRQESGEIIKDIVPFSTQFTLSALCESAMGTPLHNNAGKDKYRSSVKMVGANAFHRGVRAWLINDWMFSFTEKSKEQAKAVEILHDFTDNIIRSRKKYHEESAGKQLKTLSSGNEITEETSDPDDDMPQKKKRLALLDLLISAQKENGVIDDSGIREEVDTITFEGHDTVDMAFSFTVLLLAEHRDIQERARAEVDAVLKASDGKLRINEIQNLPYLDRCIKESLRMFPPVPLISRKITKDMQLKNHLVPSGTIVNIHIFDAHRDPNFWPQPHVYNPDRFLPEQMANRHPFSYVPFSGGPRNCIGQKFAMLEMKVFVGLLLHNFYLEPISQASNVRMLPDLVLKPMNPVNVRFIPIR